MQARDTNNGIFDSLVSLDELHSSGVNILADVLFKLLISLAGVLVVQGGDLENIARSHIGWRCKGVSGGLLQSREEK